VPIIKKTPYYKDTKIISQAGKRKGKHRQIKLIDPDGKCIFNKNELMAILHNVKAETTVMHKR